MLEYIEMNAEYVKKRNDVKRDDLIYGTECVWKCCAHNAYGSLRKCEKDGDAPLSN